MQSLALKYRPNTLEDMVEQGVTVRALNNLIKTGNYPHAILLAGPSGVGKTSAARCLARMMNNVTDPNEECYEELDAASNNGVDNVKALVKSANERSLAGYTYKIYIIDECHMITTQGWNAFLKGIEEPPAFVIYIFCTTDPNKVPSQIQNRVQRYNLTRISYKGVYDRLVKICQEEKFTNYEDTCDLISKRAHGRMRDAITLLDQCSRLSTNLDIETTKELLGNFSYEAMIKLTNNIIDQNSDEVLKYLNYLYNSGYDLKDFINTYIECIIDLNKYLMFGDINITSLPKYLEDTTDNSINVKYTVNIQNGKEYFNWLADKLLNIKFQIKNDPTYKNTIEILFLNICRGK